MNRTARLVGLAGLAASSLVVLPGGPATAEPSHWCTTSPAPCIISVEHDGVPVLASDPVWQLNLVSFDPGHDAKWDLKESGVYELTSASAGIWDVTVDMGTTVPRVSYGTGRSGEVIRPSPQIARPCTQAAKTTAARRARRTGGPRAQAAVLRSRTWR